MTIAEAREKCKSLMAGVPRDLLLLGILILAVSLSFGLGYLAGRDANSASQGGQGSSVLENPLAAATSTDGYVVAAQGGTKYYFQSCAGAARISETNKIWFVSATAATAAGYTLAAHCTKP